GIGARPEALQARTFECIDDAGNERRLGPDDGQFDLLPAREGNERGDVFRVDGDILHFRLACRAGIARRDEHALHARGLRTLPGEGVLAATTADDQDFHWDTSVFANACLATENTENTEK